MIETNTYMSVAEYLIERQRTESPDMDPTQRLLMLTLGLVGETSELLRCDFPEAVAECGDVAWYLFGLVPELLVPLTDKVRTPISTDYAYVVVAEIAEQVKKHVFHGKDLQSWRPRLRFLQRWLIANCVEATGISNPDAALGTVLYFNIAKLRERYPDGFRRASDADAARSRELYNAQRAAVTGAAQ